MKYQEIHISAVGGTSQQELGKLAERLRHEGLRVSTADKDRIRVSAHEEEMDSLGDRIRQNISQLLFENNYCVSFDICRVPASTSPDEEPQAYENWKAHVRDFCQYRAAEDELLILVKHWYRLYIDCLWGFKMCGVSLDALSGLLYIERPIARVRRIEQLLGEEAVSKAIEEAQNDFRKNLNDPIAWDLFEGDDSRQQMYSSVLDFVSEFFTEAGSMKQALQGFADSETLTAPQRLRLEGFWIDPSTDMAEDIGTMLNLYQINCDRRNIFSKIQSVGPKACRQSVLEFIKSNGEATGDAIGTHDPRFSPSACFIALSVLRDRGLVTNVPGKEDVYRPTKE